MSISAGERWISDTFPPKGDLMKNNNSLKCWVGEYQGTKYLITLKKKSTQVNVFI